MLQSDHGFTYIAALVAIMIMGIMLGTAGQSWQTLMQREREEELLFRGMQMRDALERWHNPPKGKHVRTKLNDLKDLLKDPRSVATVRYLRRLYKDPITGEEWKTVTDPMWGITGVYSASEEAPFKQGNFPDEIKEFEGKTKYSDWRFGYKLAPAPGSVTVPGSPANPSIPPPGV